MFAMVVVSTALNCSPRVTMLEGDWHGARVEGIAEELRPAAEAFAKDTQVLVRGRRIRIKTQTSSREATLRVLSEQADLVVWGEDTDAGLAEHRFEAVDVNHVRWKMSDKYTMMLVRAGHEGTE